MFQPIAKPTSLARKRIVWLFVLLLTNTAMRPFQVIVREGMAGALLRGILGTIAMGWADTLQRNLAVALAVG